MLNQRNLSPPPKPVRHLSRLPGREARAQSLVPGSVRSLSARGGDIPSSGRAIARATRHKVTTVLAPRRFRCVARKGRRSNLRVRETRQVTHTHYEIRPVRSPAHLSYRQADTPWRYVRFFNSISLVIPATRLRGHRLLPREGGAQIRDPYTQDQPESRRRHFRWLDSNRDYGSRICARLKAGHPSGMTIRRSCSGERERICRTRKMGTHTIHSAATQGRLQSFGLDQGNPNLGAANWDASPFH